MRALVRLECEHDRHFEQSIARTPKGRAKLAESRARAEIARLSEGDGNAEQISIEVPALDSEMLSSKEVIGLCP
jgi:hypothetical protein